MNESQPALNADARARLDEHLDSVERVLSDIGVSRSERRSICDEVESQACEMVWQRAEGEPTEPHMAAVLAELDSAEAYRETAEPSDELRAAHPPVTHPAIHKFALWAFLAPAGGVLLVFSPLRPPGEVPTFIWFGIVSVVFAAMAIRDIRREPSRYFGTALALFGALAIPLLVLNTLVIVQVSDINPFGHAVLKKKMTERLNVTEQQLRQAQLERHGSDVPFEMPKRVIVELSATEKWIADNAPILPYLIDISIIGATVTFSILLFVWLYKRCRPRGCPPPTAARQRRRLNVV